MIGYGVYALSKREVIRFLTVSTQTIIPPLVTAVLFIFVFGLSVGRNLQLDNMSYLSFMVPGLLTMQLISSSFENTSSSLFISKWHNHVQEILLSPLSYIEMVLGFLVGGMTRALIVATGIYAVSSLFEWIPIQHPFLLLFFAINATIIFSCAGLLAALWADNFGMLSIWSTYVITPCVFLGGVFNPLSMLPEVVRNIAIFNPLFYLVHGIRYSVIGYHEIPIQWCVVVALILSVSFFGMTVYLFKKGYKLRS